MMRRHWRASFNPIRGLLLLAVLGVPLLVWAHPEARYIQELDWKKAHFAHVLAVGYTELGSGINQSHAEVKQVGERSCVVGTSVGFDVEDTWAFDIDETVELKLTYAPALTSNPFVVVWDQNGGEGHGRIEVTPESGAPFRTLTLNCHAHDLLDRERAGSILPWEPNEMARLPSVTSRSSAAALRRAQLPSGAYISRSRTRLPASGFRRVLASTMRQAGLRCHPKMPCWCSVSAIRYASCR